MSEFVPVLSARVGKKNSRALETYVADGGYASWKKVLAGSKTGEWTPAKVTDVVKASGLRGRGGAGFPTGMKWTFVPPKEKRGDKPVYLLCNADESEPGTFKDRVLIEQDPHQILEGMMLASFALDVKHAYIYIRGEMVHGAEILNAAIQECYAAGFLGTNVLGTGLDLDVTVHRGAGAYICGEETALIESLEGKRGHPRIKPPFPAVSGAWASPTVVNNVETLVNVLDIVLEGGSAYAQIGTDASTGTKLFCVSGHVERPGVYEVPFGSTLGEMLSLAGGVRGGRSLQAVLLGGAAGGFVRPDELDLPLSFEGARAASVTLGSGVVLAFDDTVDLPRMLMRIAAFFRDESCGQCVPCRVGTVRQEEALARLLGGRGRGDELALIAEVGRCMRDASICGLGQTASGAIESAIGRLGVFAGKG